MSTGAVSGSDTTSKLLPCPFCGSDCVEVVSRDDVCHNGFCWSCAIDGPSANNKTEAEKLWNARTDRPPAQKVKITDEIDYDDPRFNQGVEHVVLMLAQTIGAEDWYHGDGSESYDDDLQETLLNILEARGLFDSDTGQYAQVQSPAESAHGKPWVCCSCDSPLSCAACGCEQPDDSEHYAKMESNLAAARAHVERLTAALKPFSDALDCVDDDAEDRCELWESPAAMDMNVGHLREARAALAPQDQQPVVHTADEEDRT